jgi:hypothetical protein
MNRIYLAVAITILGAFGLGWVIGASGRSELELGKRTAVERADMLEVRATVLQGRVALFQMNFGEASQRFGDAVTTLDRLQRELREQGLGERAGRVEVALGHLREAQRLALALDQNANNQAGEALKALGN